MEGAVTVSRVNVRQRQRRARRRSAVRRMRRLLTLEHAVNCSIGKDHAVRVALRSDGTLLGVASTCTEGRTPVTPDEEAVARSLVGKKKFYTCKDVAEALLRCARKGNTTGHYRRNWEERGLEIMEYVAERIAVGTVAAQKHNSENTPLTPEEQQRITVGRTLRALSARNWPASRYRLGTKRPIENMEAGSLKFRLTTEDPLRLTKIKVVAAPDGHEWKPIATYLGNGLFKVDVDLVWQMAEKTGEYTEADYKTGRKPCQACGRSYASLNQHCTSERHAWKVESATLDVLEIYASRLNRRNLIRQHEED